MLERATQLSLVQKQEKDGRVGKSYRYEFWHVQGRDLEGRRIRKKFSSREEALDWKNRKEIELMNRGRKLHSVITDLSDEQIKEAQACFLRLGDRTTNSNFSRHSARFFLTPCSLLTILTPDLPTLTSGKKRTT